MRISDNNHLPDPFIRCCKTCNKIRHLGQWVDIESLGLSKRSLQTLMQIKREYETCPECEKTEVGVLCNTAL